MKAIPQEFMGTTYRSRTEARWGYFFWLSGCEFRYEPEGYDLDGDWYVPDFLLLGVDVFFEVKGKEPTDAEVRKARKLAKAYQRRVVIAIGNPGDDSRKPQLRVYEPDGSDWKGFIVPEFRDEGAWVAEFAIGGGRAFPLQDWLFNCSATGELHPDLELAGKFQFQVPMFAEHDPGATFTPLGSAAADVLGKIKRLRDR